MTSRPRHGDDADDDDADVITSAPRDVLDPGANIQCDADVITSAPRDLLARGASVLASGLDESIASIRKRTARLAYLVILRDYLQAWCEACDLQRALDEADRLAFAVLELPETAEAVKRLDEARNEAEAVLALAPNPSAEATRRAYAPEPHTDRTLWDREVAQWDAKLAAHKPPAIAVPDSGQPVAAGERPAVPSIRRNAGGDR